MHPSSYETASFSVTLENHALFGEISSPASHLRSFSGDVRIHQKYVGKRSDKGAKRPLNLTFLMILFTIPVRLKLDRWKVFATFGVCSSGCASSIRCIVCSLVQRRTNVLLALAPSLLLRMMAIWAPESFMWSRLNNHWK